MFISVLEMSRGRAEMGDSKKAPPLQIAKNNYAAVMKLGTEIVSAS